MIYGVDQSCEEIGSSKLQLRMLEQQQLECNVFTKNYPTKQLFSRPSAFTGCYASELKLKSLYYGDCN